MENTKNVIKQSVVGIISFVISLLSFFSGIGLFFISGIIQMSMKGGVQSNPFVAQMIGLMAILLLLQSFIGSILGFVNLFEKSKKKVFGILGMIINTLVWVSYIVIIFIGLAMI